MNALLDALTKKIGGYAKRSTGGRFGVTRLVWDTDRDGNKVPADDRDSPCNGTEFTRPPIDGLNIREPIRFPSRCGVRVMLSDELVEDGLVSRFTLSIIDVKTASDERDVEHRQRESELERERMNGNKPQI